MDISGPRIYDIFDVMENIDIVYRSPQVSEIKDARYLLIGETHGHFSSQSDHSEVIDQNITPGSILLVEGFRALSNVTGKDREDILHVLKISKHAQKMLSVIGWDYFNHQARSKPKEHVYLCDYNKATGSSSIAIDDQSFLPLAEKLSLLEEVEYSLDVFPDEYKDDVEAVTSKARKQYMEELAQTFPFRTNAMVYTINTIEKQRQRGEIEGKIFVIAGRLHVKEENMNEDPRYSLKPLYDELQKIPAVVLYSQAMGH